LGLGKRQHARGQGGSRYVDAQTLRARQPYKQACSTNRKTVMKTRLIPLAAVALAACLVAAPAVAQVAGSTTTVGIAISESSQVAMGWSAKKSILGKNLYNDSGVKIGKVEDLIIDPEKSVSYLIVGAGGFVGLGVHSVAIPVSKIKDTAGRLVMAGASKDLIKAMPSFEYADKTVGRQDFMAAAEVDIAKGHTKVLAMEKQAGAAAADAKAKIDIQTTELKLDLKSAEDKLSAMRMAGATRWKEFEADVTTAVARLRKSLDKATTG
jgi:sporulation protein YlmC with PRC-barrel domain